MVKALQVADEIVRLLGGEQGLSRLRIHDIAEHERGISAFVGTNPMRAVLVIMKSEGGFTLTVQTLSPPIKHSTYEVPANYLKAALRMELKQRRISARTKP